MPLSKEADAARKRVARADVRLREFWERDWALNAKSGKDWAGTGPAPRPSLAWTEEIPVGTFPTWLGGTLTLEPSPIGGLRPRVGFTSISASGGKKP
jgi:hypothetical protein